jgi:predicted TIM-barrel fold metal-dependent hydrolase
VTVFDCHLLLGRDAWLAENKLELAHALALEEARLLFAAVAPDGDWLAAACPFPSAREPSYREENAAILEAASAEPRLLPVAAVNPSNAEWRAFLERSGSCLAGIQILPILCNLNLREVAKDDDFWALVKQHDLPVSIHIATGEEPSYRSAVRQNVYAPLDAVQVAEARPDIRFNLLHALRLSRSALSAVARLDNVWTDLSGYSSHGAWAECGRDIFAAADAVVGPADYGELLRILEEEFGLAGRIMFGSSEPFCRWWGSSLEREHTMYSEASRRRTDRETFAAGARQFYKNWCDL